MSLEAACRVLVRWGVGIDYKHQKDFFKELYRVLLKDTEGGLGLSLTIALRLR